MSLGVTTRVAVATAVLCAACSSPTSSTSTPPASVTPNAPATAVSNTNEVVVRTAMHDAFEDEAQWSRLYILHAFGRTGDSHLITTRLFGAEDAIASEMSGVYGPALADPLRALLHTRASDLIAIVTTETGRSANPKLRAQFVANEDAITNLLGVSGGCAQPMLDQLDARSHQDWVAETEAYDAALTCEIGLADRLTNAMVTQGRLTPGSVSGRAEELHMSLRLLLDEDALWTREMLVAEGVSTADGPAAADEAVRAANGVGTAFETFYGKDVGLEVGRGFHQATLTDALAYFLAARSGESTAAADLAAAWTKDAASLASYLAQQSSVFDATSVQRLLELWVTETKAEIDARLAHDPQADVDAYAAVVDTTRALSTTLADALVQAFPKVFD